MAFVPAWRIALGPVFLSTLAIGGCTSATGHVPHSPTVASTRLTRPALAALPCGRAQIRSAVGRFFATWDHRDRRSFARLFDATGAFDMATKNQDTLHHQEWTDSAGRGPIATFAARQWRLGEVLSFHGMTIYVGGSPAWLGGAEVHHVVTRFAGGSVQPVEEAKFNYDCSERAFTHVVIISAGVAVKP